MDTDRHWRAWGRHDPYFGVLSEDRFRSGQMDDATRDEFFASGSAHVQHLFERIHRHLGADFAPRSGLDFGCGVGRLAIPLAARLTHVLGLDISPDMLAEATRNATDAGAANATFALSDDALSQAPGRYDLVHSHIVLQHIPVQRGLPLVKALAARVADGGVLALQFPVRCVAPAPARWLATARRRIPGANAAWNLLKGRHLGDPPMLLAAYPLETLVPWLHGNGFGAVALFPDRSAGAAFDSVQLVARRMPSSPP